MGTGYPAGLETPIGALHKENKTNIYGWRVELAWLYSKISNGILPYKLTIWSIY